MDYIKLLRFDVLAVIIFIIMTIVLTTKNQKKVWRNFLCLLFSAAAVSVVVYFDFGGVGTKVAGLSAQYLAPYFAKLVSLEAPNEGVYNLMFVVTLLLAVFVVSLILKLLVKIFGGNERRKFKKNPNYAPTYKPAASFFGGILHAALFVILFYFFFAYAMKFNGISMENDLFVKYLGSYLQIVCDKIESIISAAISAA